MRLVAAAAADDALFQVDAVKNWSTTLWFLSAGLSVEFYARIERGFGLIAAGVLWNQKRDRLLLLKPL